MIKELIFSFLMLLNPDGWCQSDENSPSVWACLQLSELNRPYTEDPVSCFQADESEQVLRCCVWENDSPSGCSEIDDKAEGPIYELWCVDFQDPCRKWVYDGITDDPSLINP